MMKNVTVEMARDARGNFDSKEIIQRWVVFWPCFNAVLALTGMRHAIATPETLQDPEFWALAVVYATIANVCYGFGPAIEALVVVHGGRSRWTGYLVITAATVLAAMLTDTLASWGITLIST